LRAAFPRPTIVTAPVIDAELGEVLQRMVGFRNVAVHADQAPSLPIVRAIVERHLDDLQRFGRIALELHARPAR
jgi:uncharacterized protein YutE (UPF0331/DUF86 family)